MKKKCGFILTLVFSYLLTTMSALAQVASIDTFVLTKGHYSETDDLQAMVQQEYGQSAQVADWEEIKHFFYGKNSDTIAHDLDKVGLKYNESALLYRNGTRLWSGNRHYMLTRHDGKLPQNYLSHDHIENHTLDLSSWYEVELPILVKIDLVSQIREEGKQDGIKAVQNNPSEYGLFTQAQMDEKARDKNENTDKQDDSGLIFTGNEIYSVGHMLDIKLDVSIKASHLQQVDLWVIIKLPDQLSEKLGIRFLYITGDFANPYEANPVPFKRSLQQLDNTYSILSFEVPPKIGGEYIFYAFLTQENSELDFLFSTLRSNVTEKKVMLMNQ
jgi:hypothetical protein